jgi:hypothetical protein
MDFYFVEKPLADAGHSMSYILVLMDDYSRFVDLIACESANAAAAVSALLAWFSRFGSVPHWSSDQGSHFIADVVRDLCEQTHSDQRFSVAHAHHANGKIERANRDLHEILVTILFDSRTPSHNWPTLLPIVAMVMNHSPSTALGGLSPVTVFTQLPPSSPLEAVFDPDSSSLRDVRVHVDKIRQRVEDLRTVITERHLQIIKARDRPFRRRPGERPIDFAEGDYVLCTSPVRRPKTSPRWIGPYRLVAFPHDNACVVESLLPPYQRKTLHAQFVKRYSDKDLVVTPELLEFVQFNGEGYIVDSIIGYRRSTSGYLLQVKWALDSSDQASWEPLKSMYEDVPGMVRRYLNSVSDRDSRRRMLAVVNAM